MVEFVMVVVVFAGCSSGTAVVMGWMQLWEGALRMVMVEVFAGCGSGC